MAVLDVQFMKLPGCSCAASYFFIMSSCGVPDVRGDCNTGSVISVIKDMYDNDEYILMDGEKRAR
eukprot:696557-Pelagomonas_calceolata.AAC.1